MKKRFGIWLLIGMVCVLFFSSAAVFALDTTEDENHQAGLERYSENLTAVVMENKQLIIGEDAEQAIQKIALVFKDELEENHQFFLEYQGTDGVKNIMTETGRTEKAVLFEKDFRDQAYGNYQLLGIKMIHAVSNEEKTIAFDDLDMDLSFNLSDGSQALEVQQIILDNTDSVETDIADGVEEILNNVAVGDSTELTTNAKANVVVVINPGHGGSDPGAMYYGLEEKNLNLTIAKACRDELKKYNGVSVYLTREGDTDESSKDIINFATSKNANLLVSIHNNASASHDGQGFEIYYPNANYRPSIGAEGKEISEDIETELAKLGLVDRGIRTRTEVLGVDDDYEECMYPDGSAGDWYFINRWAKEANYIGIIIEHAFMDNYSDYFCFLSSETELKKMGVADATGIANYYGLSKVKKGDINLDGSVTILDARMAKRAAMKVISLSDNQLEAGDLDGNGIMTINEARKIKRVVLKETKF